MSKFHRENVKTFSSLPELLAYARKADAQIKNAFKIGHAELKPSLLEGEEGFFAMDVYEEVDYDHSMLDWSEILFFGSSEEDWDRFRSLTSTREDREAAELDERKEKLRAEAAELGLRVVEE